MATINVIEKQPFPTAEFQVVVNAEVKTEHTVTLKEADYQRLKASRTSPEDLIKDSFRFLLGRESNTSILSSFNLTLIGTYFPEYEKDITT